ncbi:MAG: biotin/lipoyl-binding protein [Anaerolineae bacterium]|nr:biotin/lipoyl-binding protein [Anaerolineae bacterium]
MKYQVRIEDHTFDVNIDQDGIVTVDGEPVAFDFGEVDGMGLYSLLVNNESYEALVEQSADVYKVLMRGYMYDVHVLDERSRILQRRSNLMAPDTGEVAVRAPMPGLIVDVPVEIGQEVEAGQKVVILESMKMENELKTPRAGRVERINVAKGDSVEQNEALVVIV